MSKSAEWIADALGAIKDSSDCNAIQIIEACGRGCAQRQNRIVGMESMREAATHCKTRTDYMAFLNEKIPVRFVEVSDGIEMHLGKTECSCPIAKGITKNKEMLCHCTCGADKAVWSAFFGKEVDVEIVESFLRGGNECISSQLRSRYGNSLPIFVYNVTNLNRGDKDFYRNLLLTLNHPEFSKGTAIELKNRLMSALINHAFATHSHKIILFIDEAYNLTNMDFMWLMDMYNELALKNITLITLLVGSYELKARKAALNATKQHQIIGRFMIYEYEFKGISDIKDIVISLMNFDNPMNIDGKELILTELYFPLAYQEGRKLATCVNELHRTLRFVMKKYNISENIDIPMQYYMNIIKYIFFEFGITGKAIFFPDKVAWSEAIEFSGLIQSESGVGK